jgi:hypothetical protein
MTTAISPAGAGFEVAVCRTRFGVKGREAAQLLQHCGVPVPATANAMIRWRGHGHFGDGRCLRLGHSEFVLEQDDGHALLDAVRGALPPADGSSWFVHRADHCLLLNGPAWPAQLARVCSFDFEQLRREPDRVVMTLLADVGVTLVPEPSTAPDALTLRLWCDPGYATYLHQCLHSLSLGLAEITGDSR